MNEKEKQIDTDVFALAAIQSLLVGNEYATALVAQGAERADHKEKQIEEMARIIDDNHGFIVSSVETAEALYNADYRKQSVGEWREDVIAFCNVCSLCKAKVDRYAVKCNSGKLNYCPNCGARMGGGEE